MNFRLERKAAGAALTKFNVTDGKGTIYGSVNVPNAAASDLQKHWRGPTAVATARGEKARVVNAMLASSRRAPRLSREGVLRGSS